MVVALLVLIVLLLAVNTMQLQVLVDTERTKAAYRDQLSEVISKGVAAKTAGRELLRERLKVRTNGDRHEG